MTSSNKQTKLIDIGSVKITLAEWQHMMDTDPNLQIKGRVHATYFGWGENGTGVWVHDHVTDEVDEQLRKLPPGIDQKTICKNLEAVGAVYYEHWEMHPDSKAAMMPHGESEVLDWENKEGRERRHDVSKANL